MTILTFRACTLGAVLICSVTKIQPVQGAEDQKCAEPQPVNDPTYRPGQVWAYKARPGETSSTITILKVETLPKVGVVVHTRIDGFQFHNCTGGPAPNNLEHAPFAKTAIDRSVTRQLRTASALPQFEEGYKEWLSHCGGVYTITVAEMLDADQTTFSAGLGCSR